MQAREGIADGTAVSDFLDSAASIFSNQLRNSMSRGRDRDCRISRRSSGGLPRTSPSTAYSAAMRVMASAAMAGRDRTFCIYRREAEPALQPGLQSWVKRKASGFPVGNTLNLVRGR
jgi:hypothetical protein